MDRRKFTEGIVSVLVMVYTSGCNVPVVPEQTYREVVSSILISADGKKLVVVTSRFHYIFDTSPAMIKALQGKYHEFLSAKFSGFHVSRNGKINGSISLSLSGAPDNVVAGALAVGFSKTVNGTIFNTVLNGFRYNAGVIPSLKKYQLNRTYEIEVSSELVDEEARITPVTVLGGGLVVAGIALFAVAIIVNCAVTGNLKNCHE